MQNGKTVYQMCIDLAKQSPCQKRGFGCVALTYGSMVAQDNNHPLECAKHLCEPTCIRLKINSGSDSLISACGHAEEHTIWQIINHYGDAKGTELYVAGVSKPDNEPLIKSAIEFYCIRCATLMQYAGVRGVYIWFENKWCFLTTEEAYASSLKFALREKIGDG